MGLNLGTKLEYFKHYSTVYKKMKINVEIFKYIYSYIVNGKSFYIETTQVHADIYKFK